MKHSLRGKINDLIISGIKEVELLTLLEREYPNPIPQHPQHTIITHREELIVELRSFQSAKIIARYKKQSLAGKSTKELLLFTMDNSIYRAFHHETPSLRYLGWRWYSTPDLLLNKMIAIRDQATFDHFAYDIGKSLVTDWGTKNDKGGPTKMNIGVAMKIINIALKHFTFSDLCTNPILMNFLHVPWDSFTLRPLRHIWLGNPAILSNAGQGFVKDLTTYQSLNSFISEITKEAGVSRIIYEFWAWDASH